MFCGVGQGPGSAPSSAFLRLCRAWRWGSSASPGAAGVEACSVAVCFEITLRDVRKISK